MTPLEKLPCPGEFLGRDGADTYLLCGQDVYRQNGRYYYPAGRASCWPQSSVAKRIAGRDAERAADAAKVDKAMDDERARRRR